MRQKMKIIKSKSDIRIKQDAWAKWRQLLRSHHAESHYQLTLLSRCLAQWKARIVHLDDLDIVADNFSQHVQLRSTRNLWDLWKHITRLRRSENIMAGRVDYRAISTAFDLWRMRKTAVQYNQHSVLKHAILKWKQARNTLVVQERRAEKHLTRQNDVLLRAVVRIWRARMRAKRMEQFRSSLAQRNAWHKWKASLAIRKSQNDDAAAFYNRSNSRLVSETVHRWHQILATHQNAYSYAVAFDAARLRVKMVLLWRVRLRETLQSAKIARWANKFFATRRAWQTWAAAMEEKKRQKRLELWSLTRTRKCFKVWQLRWRQAQYFKQFEQTIQRRAERRILTGALIYWTNRVIEVKSRELDVAHQENASLKRAAFQKWRLCRLRHIEEVSLLENYVLVKQEDILRRAFHRWLTAKRSAVHRRLTHERKEAQLRQMTIIVAWDRWREKFKEEKLRPLEYQLIFESQKNMMSKAFRLWLSKTESLPAVRFHSMHIKEKFFKRWRSMIPNALRAKKARDLDRYNTLVTYFEKWTNAYKTKITLKAVA
ncbi:hypothetical protein CPB84DRAFT_894306 [Gymnopilus junonius]|uniref:Sfi1 spindle body domain-containing protein n=1 Tax=Gymnopilus junonius TaxID=109634 RepID=A0A9P5TN09_GYMJU|nr:hypothetical protein CPB84DRAFT_894306 [Gymnopilus junonius]